MDASALVKLVQLEQESVALRRYLRRHDGDERVTCTLSRVEVVRAVLAGWLTGNSEGSPSASTHLCSVAGTRSTRETVPVKRGVLVRRTVGGALAAYVLLVRNWHLRWGATHDEVVATLPGDVLLAGPDLVATRAVTIAAEAGDVWPWLAQLGQGRGGFYSYDALENFFARCDIHSADRIVPEWQYITVGDEVKLHPDVPLTVAIAEPGRALVFRGGVPMGQAPAPYDFTWAFVLHDRPDGSTRLVVRERYAYSKRWARLIVEPVEVVSFVMSQRMRCAASGTVSRAERTAPETPGE